jgi:hypothetical protein
MEHPNISKALLGPAKPTILYALWVANAQLAACRAQSIEWGGFRGSPNSNKMILCAS